jgi:hypothetical protein
MAVRGTIPADAHLDRRERIAAKKLHDPGQVDRPAAPLPSNRSVRAATLEADDSGMHLLDVVRLERTAEHLAETLLQPLQQRRKADWLPAVMRNERHLHHVDARSIHFSTTGGWYDASLSRSATGDTDTEIIA